MAEDEFGTPPSTSGVDWEAEKGNLLCLKGYETKYGIPTEYGQSDALIARVLIVDGPNAGQVHEGTYVFPKVLASAGSKPYGRVIVGRLTQGVAKGKNNPPWLLADPTDAEFDTARRAWKASLTSAPEFGKPTESANAPGPSPY